MSLQIYIPACLSNSTEFLLILTRPIKNKNYEKFYYFPVPNADNGVYAELSAN
jgi:hypothetical protein